MSASVNTERERENVLYLGLATVAGFCAQLAVGIWAPAAGVLHVVPIVLGDVDLASLAALSTLTQSEETAIG